MPGAGLQPLSLPAAGVENLLQSFQRHRNEICLLHYGGHADDERLWFSDTASADADSLAAFLAQQQALKLVFLNGCSTEQQAQALLDAGVEAVIATSRAIEDTAARDFARTFYRGLVNGATVTQAYHEASSGTLMSRGADFRSLYWQETEAAQTQALPWKLFPPAGSEWTLPQASLPAADAAAMQANIIQLRDAHRNRIRQDSGSPAGEQPKRNQIEIDRGSDNFIWQDVRGTRADSDDSAD